MFPNLFGPNVNNLLITYRTSTSLILDKNKFDMQLDHTRINQIMLIKVLVI